MQIHTHTIHIYTYILFRRCVCGRWIPSGKLPHQGKPIVSKTRGKQHRYPQQRSPHTAATKPAKPQRRSDAKGPGGKQTQRILRCRFGQRGPVPATTLQHQGRVASPFLQRDARQRSPQRDIRFHSGWVLRRADCTRVDSTILYDTWRNVKQRTVTQSNEE